MQSMRGGVAATRDDDLCVGRPLKPDDKKRKRIVFTLAPTSIALLPLIADELGIDAGSRVIDKLIEKEAKRLRLRPKE